MRAGRLVPAVRAHFKRCMLYCYGICHCRQQRNPALWSQRYGKLFPDLRIWGPNSHEQAGMANACVKKRAATGAQKTVFSQEAKKSCSVVRGYCCGGLSAPIVMSLHCPGMKNGSLSRSDPFKAPVRRDMRSGMGVSPRMDF